MRGTPPRSRGAGSAARPKSRRSRTPTHGHPDRSRTGASTPTEVAQARRPDRGRTDAGSPTEVAQERPPTEVAQGRRRTPTEVAQA
eukprot:5292835-Alexandrium_andersonii.AAC.1